MINGLESNVKIKAKVLPSAGDCRFCTETANSYNAIPNCANCHKERNVTILQFVKNFFGCYAIAINGEGLIEEIPTHLLKTDFFIPEAVLTEMTDTAK